MNEIINSWKDELKKQIYYLSDIQSESMYSGIVSHYGDKITTYGSILNILEVISVEKFDLNKHIGRNIKIARKNKKITQDELAEKTGLSRTSITNIETGKQTPSIQLVMTIAEILDTSVADLLRTDHKRCPLCGQMTE